MLALKVIECMKLLEQVSGARTKLKGMFMVDTDGVESWRSSQRGISAGRFDGEDIETVLDDLANILVTATSDVTYRFSSIVNALQEQAHSAFVTFVDGASERFNLAVGAGLCSKIQHLVSESESKTIDHLGMGPALVGAYSLAMESTLQPSSSHTLNRSGFSKPWTWRPSSAPPDAAGLSSAHFPRRVPF